MHVCALGAIIALWCPHFTGTIHPERAQKVHAKRPVTMADAIRMTKLGNGDGGVANFSPDGTKFVVVIRRGNLENNTNEYSLLLWKTERIFTRAEPSVLLTMSSSSNREAISDVKWLIDNETVAFLGERPKELRQLYTFNTRTRILREITKHRSNVLAYSLTPEGDQVAYLAEKPVESTMNEKMRREGVVVTTQRLRDLLLGQERARFDSDIGINELYILKGPSRRKLAELYGAPFPISLSPNARYVVILNEVQQIPQDWTEYTNPYLHEWTRMQFQPGQYSSILRYELIDTTTAQNRVLLNSPTFLSSVAWSSDSGSVILCGTYLPLADSLGEERQARQSTTYTVEVEVPTGEFTKISDEELHLLGWDWKNHRIVFESGTPLTTKPTFGPKVYFRKNLNKWEKMLNVRAEEVQPDISLQQGMNTPPKIFALDQSSHRKALLLDLNPQFEALTFGRVQEIEWKATDGRAAKGGLYYPIDYVPGKKYPLVIQTHLWDPRKFWIDGPWTTAFAAQPLAGKDIMVLQADEESFESKDFDTPAELPREVARLEGAIDFLDREGLIDRNRVGLIGFSRSGDIVAYAMTHSKYHFAAASVADGGDQGYFTYMVLGNTAAGHELEFVNGAAPFGDGLTSWLSRSSEFNLDKTQTPLRLLALGPDLLLSEWGWFAGSFRLAKPVEMVYLPDAVHVLEKPWERMVSQDTNVDWFCFWLEGEEDPDPAKAEQYKRWRELRKLQGQNEARPQAAPAR